ncbi:CLUMA_CG000359, isoform A [Clunio marinus]|uniref:CLUMA_CG000359, isoform A n=1 Tax=Clunio marinus TaxID=568069 RepID=A0A1J1HEE4_9DIPT|nr:CLUMA_CG000359, isoform A [Clunio marinus]
MPCLSTFCCGYGLRSGGSFIGYFSILVYIKLLILCLIFLGIIKYRIDESEGNNSWSIINQISNLIRVRSNIYTLEASLQELKTYGTVLIVYLVFLLFGILCASFLITGARLRKPSYLWWWLIYQGVFILVTAGIVILFIYMKDEKYGFLSYLKNYFIRLLITIFLIIYISFVVLVIYFWLAVLSLHTYLKKHKVKAKTSVAESQVDLTKDIRTDNMSTSSNSIQMIPINIPSIDTEEVLKKIMKFAGTSELLNKY